MLKVAVAIQGHMDVSCSMPPELFQFQWRWENLNFSFLQVEFDFTVQFVPILQVSVGSTTWI